MATIRGTKNGESLTGTAGDDFIFGFGGTDTIDGGEGNDTIFAGENSGSDMIDGGDDAAGDDTDVLVLSDDYTNYDIAFSGGNIVLTNGGVAETVTHVEQIAFNDHAILVVGAGSAYTTIQDAVDAASDGDTILVQGATYAEQLVIHDKANLTIKALDGDTVNIVAPNDLHETVRDSSGREVNAVVSVTDSTNVVFDNINIDGAGKAATIDENDGAGQANFVGIVYRNASGDLINVDVIGVRDASLGGGQRGFGIQVDNDSQMHFGMSGGSITDFQKNAAVFNGADLDVHGVTVTGAGATDINAQNGFLATNSTGSLHDNIVTGIGYTGAAAAYSGLFLLYSNTNLNVIDNIITGTNNVDFATKSVGIFEVVYPGGAPNDGGEITGNTISYVDEAFDVSGLFGAGGLYIHDNIISDLDNSDFEFTGAYFEPDAGSTGPFNVEGTGYGDVLIGGGADDSFTGFGGADYLDGAAGDDTLTGGDGNDTYYVDQAGDRVVEVENEGTDTVHAEYDGYTLAANAENLVLDETGSSLSFVAPVSGVISGNGNDLANTIIGNSADNVINGAGGDDTINSGSGTDTAVFDGNFVGHTVSFAGGEITVTDTDISDGDSGEDTLTGTEILQFADTRVLIVDASNAFGSFSTIQSAVDEANAGDTIIVRAGTYTENVVVGKGITILGAFAGTAGADGERTASDAGGETNLIGNVTISGSALVTIDGLRFEETNAAQNGYGQIHATSGNVVLTNNVFYSDVNGGATEVRAIYVNPGIDGTATITNNYITGQFTSGYGGASYRRGVWYDGADGSNVVVDHNKIEYARAGINADLSGDSLLTISSNDFHVTGTGTAIGYDVDGLTLTGNNYLDTGEELLLRNVASAISYDATDDVVSIEVTTGTAYYDLIAGAGDDHITGTSYNDLMEGNQLDPVGGTDADTFYGAGGNDVLLGEGGDDYLDGGTGGDALFGGTGNDTYVVDDALDTVTEGVDEGTDLVITTLASYTMTANVENLSYTGANSFTGTGNDGDNTVTGGSGGDRLSGGAGIDTLNGGGGNDRLIGGDGNDVLVGGAGNDTYVLNGTDTLVEDADSGKDTVQAGRNISLSNPDYANIENATLTGIEDRSLTGSDDANRLIGNSGNNTITGGAGADILTGGGGNDHFVYTSVSDSSDPGQFDRITDFTGTDAISGLSNDLIDLFKIDAKAHSVGNNAFTFIGSDNFSGGEGELRFFVNVAGNTVIQLNTDNTHAGAEMSIVLADYTAPLIDADFIL